MCNLPLIVAAAFVKETCYDEEAGPLSSEVITRLYHAESRRYICFNKKGKIRTVVSESWSIYYIFDNSDQVTSVYGIIQGSSLVLNKPLVLKFRQEM